MKYPKRVLPFLHNVARVSGLAAWQTGRLFRKTALAALESIQEVLRSEVKKGNVKLVADFLANKAMPAARTLLLERMAARLLVRIGLRGVLASNVVGWVLPFVLEKLLQLANKAGVFEKIKANDTVVDALHRLDELKRATIKVILPDAGSSAQVMDNDAELPKQLH
jgi:hypothetical protein